METQRNTHIRSAHRYRSTNICRSTFVETSIDPEDAHLETDRPWGKTHADQALPTHSPQLCFLQAYRATERHTRA